MGHFYPPRSGSTRSNPDLDPKHWLQALVSTLSCQPVVCKECLKNMKFPVFSFFGFKTLDFQFYGFSVLRSLKINLFFNCFPVLERREWRWETKMTFPLPTRNCWADSSSKIALTHISHFFFLFFIYVPYFCHAC